MSFWGQLDQPEAHPDPENFSRTVAIQPASIEVRAPKAQPIKPSSPVRATAALENPPGTPETVTASVRQISFPSANGDGFVDCWPLTEAGNSARLEQSHGKHLRFVTETGGWLIWHHGAWRHDPDAAHARRMAMSLGDLIYAEGANISSEFRERVAGWAAKSQSARVIENSIKLLTASEYIRVSAGVLDSDPWLAGFDQARQVIDLRSGSARPATEGDLVTKSLGVDRIGCTTECPRWLQFLNEILIDTNGQADCELIQWMQRWVGYVLSGRTDEQVALFAIGIGRNAKSVFATVLARLLGDYCRTLPAESLMTDPHRTGNGASPDLAMLPGARLVLASEGEDGASLAEARLKSLTGGDSVTCRPLYGKPLTFNPTFKLLFTTNHKPIVRGTDHGIWRRLRLIEFRARFDAERCDPKLTEKLIAELPAIAGWAIQGCLEWQHAGLADIPMCIEATTAGYRDEMDTLAEFIRDYCCQHGEVLAKELYRSYKRWADESGLRITSIQALGRRLAERGYSKRRTHNGPTYAGISLQEPPF